MNLSYVPWPRSSRSPPLASPPTPGIRLRCHRLPTRLPASPRHTTQRRWRQSGRVQCDTSLHRALHEVSQTLRRILPMSFELVASTLCWTAHGRRNVTRLVDPFTALIAPSPLSRPGPPGPPMVLPMHPLPMHLLPMHMPAMALWLRCSSRCSLRPSAQDAPLHRTLSPTPSPRHRLVPPPRSQSVSCFSQPPPTPLPTAPGRQKDLITSLSHLPPPLRLVVRPHRAISILYRRVVSSTCRQHPLSSPPLYSGGSSTPSAGLSG
mmetsp:Transcript_10113/g.20581  ORF Transcript_10113/g.20581 Transcript_10113/m.20581 type:complete len:264 (-) Transcript_10113:723-1514(-)